MASFAKLDNNNIVITVESVVNEVLKDSNGIEQEQLGINFLRTLYNEPNAIWKKTSYNTIGGTHNNGGIPFRKNHAGIGYTYDENRDAFIPPKPFNSWIINETTCFWEAPIAKPTVQLEENQVIPKKTIFPKGNKKTSEEKEFLAQEKILIEQAKSLPNPKRASLPKGVTPESVTLEMALGYLVLPRTLGLHPESHQPIIANIGRFGPYVGHERDFRSIKPRSGYDAYTISLEQALELLQQAKSLPKGTTLAKELGKHPKTGKSLQVLQSRSGYYIPKGLKRVYLPQGVDIETFNLEDALKLLS